ELGNAAVRLVLLAGYRGAATVEFLYQTDRGALSFMEVNTRLQVEHPVTEATTGVDLLKLQLQVAAGRPLEGAPPAPVGHAIEARINAEDPALGFIPAPGRIALLRFPGGPGIRIDAGFAEGDSIPARFDSMIAKLIAWGRDRDEALARLRRALAETTIVVEGGTTNVGFLVDLLARPELRAGEIDTGWLDRLQLRGETIAVRHAEVALVAAAVHFADEQTAVDRATFYAFARRGRPESQAAARREIDLRYSGQRYRMAISEIGPSLYRVTLDGISVEVNTERLNPHERRLWLGGHGFRVVTSSQGADLLIEVDGVSHRISRDDGGLVRNPAPAVVVSIPVEPGEEVAAGDVVAVIEIMKMESSLTAPVDGRVREVLVGPNVQVGAQEALLRIEPLEPGESASGGAPRVRLPIGEQVSADRETFCREGLRRLEWLVLGYDAEPGEVERVLADLQGASGDPPAYDLGLVPEEDRLLSVYADVQALSRPAHDESEFDAEPLLSPREHLNAYLRSLDSEAEGLPDQFVWLLERALSHYGIEQWDRTPELEEACYRLFLAQQRAEHVRVAIVALLDRRLEQVEALSGQIGADFRELLDRLTAAAEGRDRILTDLSREVRFRYFDQPVIDAATVGAYRDAEAQLTELAADPEADGRGDLVKALVDCPRPLAPMLSERLRAAGPSLRRALLEVMTRRYYRRHALEGFEEHELRRESLLTATHPEDGGRRRVASVYVTLDRLPAAVTALARYADTLGGERLVADFYANYESEPSDQAALAERLGSGLAEADPPTNLDRVVFAIAAPGRGRGMSAVDIFTYRRSDSGMTEDELLRGVHPEMADRLQLKRLANFTLERLPSPAEDVYLLLGRARENPKDERLFALAEVRDLTPVHDPDGRVTSLPEFERMLVHALGGIRHFQAH
ncbi:MAG TPA: biotin/lipoyl-containing protein, partial [Solirubrobacterales bacterium]|nr:biotin/lipoyl-containing protein [Solirubrobacterales bacterium]